MENQFNLSKMIHNMEQIIVGKREVIEYTLITLLAGGHLLLEDVPGVGKTTLAKTVAIYNMQSGRFEYSKGAIMNNIILADEINRTSPKTQASLLEAMEEKQVTVDGVTYPIGLPFMVIATQNPVDYLGTYNLPEAQLDRFMMKLSIGYPHVGDEQVMVDRFLNHQLTQAIEAIVEGSDILLMQKEVEQVKVNQDLVAYATKITHSTRKDSNILLGASPRATLALLRAGQAMAYLSGRNYCIPDDIIKLVEPVLAHRIIMSPEARLSQIKPGAALKLILNKIAVPVLASV